MVGEELREAGYCNVDGLDPSQGYLNGAVARGIFRHVFRAFIDPDSPVSAISDNSYDALLCCAGFFQVETIFDNASQNFIFDINLLDSNFYSSTSMYR